MKTFEEILEGMQKCVEEIKKLEAEKNAIPGHIAKFCVRCEHILPWTQKIEMDGMCEECFYETERREYPDIPDPRGLP